MSQTDFSPSKKKIIKFILFETPEGGEELALKAYNHGVEDTIDFINELVKPNPQYAAAYLSLIETLKYWLPLRDGVETNPAKGSPSEEE